MNQWHRQQSANDLGNKEKWTSDGFDASDWKKVDVFNSNWGGSWNTPLNGVHYFRQRINIPESLAGQQAVLRVGTLKDSDATYINGICVGRTSYQYPTRIYKSRQTYSVPVKTRLSSALSAVPDVRNL